MNIDLENMDQGPGASTLQLEFLETRTTVREGNTVLVCTLEAFNEVLSSKQSGLTVILGGDLVLVGLEPLPEASEYVKQEPRRLPGIKNWLSKRGSVLHVYVHRDAINVWNKTLVKPKLRLHIDCYLKWISVSKMKEFLLLTGTLSNPETLITYYHVKRGMVVGVKEKSVYSPDMNKYKSGLSMLMESFHTEYKGVSIVSVMPLMEVDIAQELGVSCVEFSKVFKPGFSAINTGRATNPFSGLDIVVKGVLLSGVVYGGIVGYPYYEYSKLAGQFKEESSQLSQDYRYASDLLKLLQGRKAYLAQKDVSVVKTKAYLNLLNELGKLQVKHGGFRVKSALLRSDTKPEAGEVALKPAFELTLVVADVGGVSLIDRINPLIQELLVNTGVPSIRVSPYSIRDSQDGMKQFKLEGDL